MPSLRAYETPIAVRRNGTVNMRWGSRTPFFQRAYAGSNAHLLDMLGHYREHIGIAASATSARFADQADRTRALLAGQTAQVSLSIVLPREATHA